LKVLVLGYGVRGRVYAGYIRSRPDLFELAGIADPAAPEADWRDWREALEAETSAQGAIIALPDALHLAAAEAALAKGLHILLEKPLGCTWEECERLAAAQRRARRLVLTGYVLRFSALYLTLRDVLRSGAIGEITAINHLVAIGYGKSAHAFCRGNWGREADGSTVLVQKCTHDFDLIEWWKGSRKLKRIASFGSLVEWREDAKPHGAAARCVDCPAAVRKACPFDAVRLYVESDDLRYHFSDRSDAAMRRMVEESRYGRCVYCCGNDAVNRQSVLMEYEGGLTVTLDMESFTKRRGRFTRFFGTRGEISVGSDSVRVMPFNGEDYTVRPEGDLASMHHDGGDVMIMAAFHRLATKAPPERYGAILDGAMRSHRLAFLAESSRLAGKC